MAPDLCTRCGHDNAKHGSSGCVVGWFAPENECFCPNDWEGNVATACQYIDCINRTPTHVDSLGCFYCAEHARLERGARAIDAITSWQAS